MIRLRKNCFRSCLWKVNCCSYTYLYLITTHALFVISRQYRFIKLRFRKSKIQLCLYSSYTNWVRWLISDNLETLTWHTLMYNRRPLKSFVIEKLGINYLSDGLWLWVTTHVGEVMGSNPSAIYWMDIFCINFL